ncbi:hypothetical protein ACHAP6_004720 [Verticillium nonalfalfae]
MAEPIGAISGVAGLIIFATNLSVGISRRIDAVRGLPRTLQALSADLKGFVSVLGTLQGYLDHEDTRQGVLHPGTVDELSDVLEDCIQVFTELSQQLNKDLNGSGEASADAKMSTWRRLRLSFRDKDFEELRAKLAARKLTLTVAVSVANFINTSSHVGMTWQMQSDLQVMKAEVSAVLQRLETMQASESLPGPETATTRRARAPQLKALPSEVVSKRAAPLLFDSESSGLSLLNLPSSDTHEKESEEESDGILLAGLPRQTGNIKPGQPLFSNEFFEIRKSPLGGMGAFAVQDLGPGDMILMERAVVRSTDVDRDLIRHFTNLSASDKGLVLDLAMHKPSRIAHDDSLHTRLKAIFTTNYFACTTKAPGHGLFLVASRFNHACRPHMNVNYGFDRELDALVFTVAGGQVKAGTELTINYGKDAASLKAVYGFECACGGDCKISRQRQDAREWGIDLQ